MDGHAVAEVLFGALVSVAVSVVGYFMNRLFKQVDEMQKNLQANEVKAAKEFVTREHIERLETAIFSKLDTIGNKLETLAIKIASSEHSGRQTGI